jgi:hypothetical protein
MSLIRASLLHPSAAVFKKKKCETKHNAGAWLYAGQNITMHANGIGIHEYAMDCQILHIP